MEPAAALATGRRRAVAGHRRGGRAGGFRAPAEALLLCGWLRGRLGRQVALDHEERDEIERVEVDGVAAVPIRLEQPSAVDLLSDELELFGRDPVYEEAVRSLA